MSLLVRLDPGHGDSWDELVSAVSTENEDGFRADVELVDDPAWYQSSFARLGNALRDYDGAAVMFAADDLTLTAEDHPVVVIDILGERPAFRCIASELWSVEKNLNLANMDWEEFSRAVDRDGVHRGFA